MLLAKKCCKIRLSQTKLLIPSCKKNIKKRNTGKIFTADNLQSDSQSFFQEILKFIVKSINYGIKTVYLYADF